MEENHLPVFGVGPYLVLIIGIITVASFILSYYRIIPVFSIDELNIVFLIFGTILIVFGIAFWISAVLISKIDVEVESNNLVTTGIYAYVRHPIYSAFFYISIGLILISRNILLFILPLIFWEFLTVAMKKTEERWLIERYGDDYLEYSKKVNRFFPRLR